MAYILHLETATKVCSVGLSKNGSLIAIKETKEEGYSHGENLTLFILSVLKDANVTMDDLDAVSVASGPGSYTGLRIGVSTAKGLCFAKNIPLIAIDALTSLVEQAKEFHPGANLCAMIDARRMEVYNLITNDGGERLKEISADIIDELSYSTFEPFIYFGDGAAKLEEVWKEKNFKSDLSILSSAKGQVKLAYQMFQSKDFVDTAYFEPFYLKDFIAGKKKKD
ncbi:MAG: tRNA (adenosine(37)-N6)-threonylcarbamoyltransferase complex dimerization subunit type 1 TsaB [Crocinitomicaceae bacterium]|nr:tRNA (adenosine(37)-N6)-threonylcarbamoyltransferase complex dimerization subunit type 1 TsaB [Crocinitomicaceae bacterium]